MPRAARSRSLARNGCFQISRRPFHEHCPESTQAHPLNRAFRIIASLSPPKPLLGIRHGRHNQQQFFPERRLHEEAKKGLRLAVVPCTPVKPSVDIWAAPFSSPSLSQIVFTPWQRHSERPRESLRADQSSSKRSIPACSPASPPRRLPKDAVVPYVENSRAP